MQQRAFSPARVPASGLVVPAGPCSASDWPAGAIGLLSTWATSRVLAALRAPSRPARSRLAAYGPSRPPRRELGRVWPATPAHAGLLGPATRLRVQLLACAARTRSSAAHEQRRKNKFLQKKKDEQERIRTFKRKLISQYSTDPYKISTVDAQTLNLIDSGESSSQVKRSSSPLSTFFFIIFFIF